MNRHLLILGFCRLRHRIREWYEGEYIPPDNPPDSPVVFLMGHYDRPLLARLITRCIRFYLDHWKWVIGTLLFGGIALVLAILEYCRPSP